MVTKLPCGGGEGAAHSSVVAFHGLFPTFLPNQMLWKKLKMNGICASPSSHAETDMNTFQWSAGATVSLYARPPSNPRRCMPAMPSRNIGKKMPLMKTNEQ